MQPSLKYAIHIQATIALFLLHQYLISLTMMLTLHLSNILFSFIKTYIQQQKYLQS